MFKINEDSIHPTYRLVNEECEARWLYLVYVRGDVLVLDDD